MFSRTQEAYGGEMNKPEWRPADWGTIVKSIKCYFDEKRSVTVNVDVLESGASAMLAALLKWLDEPCTNHVEDCIGYGRDWEEDDRLGSHDGWDTAYYLHHKDCPQCLNELKESVK